MRIWRGGIALGHGCVVAAHAMVTRSVWPYTIVGGNSARVIRARFEPAVIERLLRSEWWRYRFTDFGGRRHDRPALFLDQRAVAVERETIRPFAPPKARLSAPLPG